jgi:hypothetical protein
VYPTPGRLIVGNHFAANRGPCDLSSGSDIASDGFLTLLPGQNHTYHVTSTLTPGSYRAQPVFYDGTTYQVLGDWVTHDVPGGSCPN